jgi:hypothetical protein
MNLWKDFYKMPSEVIYDVDLKKKPLPRKNSVPSRGQSSKGPKPSKKKNEDKPAKKSRKE